MLREGYFCFTVGSYLGKIKINAKKPVTNELTILNQSNVSINDFSFASGSGRCGGPLAAPSEAQGSRGLPAVQTDSFTRERTEGSHRRTPSAGLRGAREGRVALRK